MASTGQYEEAPMSATMSFARRDEVPPANAILRLLQMDTPRPLETAGARDAL
jgi:hypothetical protein